jgi:hypothetical protein
MTMTDITESAEDTIRVLRVRKLHKPFRIYEECDHGFLLPEHGDDVVLIECEDFTTCEAGYMYSVCAECCCDGVEQQTEECAGGHEHDGSKPLCRTLAALDEPVAGVTVGA